MPIIFRCAILVLLCQLGSPENKPIDQVVAEPTLENLLFGLEKLMFFFTKRYAKLNVDGLFGVRAVEGEMQRLLDKAESGDYPALKRQIGTQNRIKKILNLASETVELAMPEVKKADFSYYENFLLILESPWTMLEVAPERVKEIILDELPRTKKNMTGTVQKAPFHEDMSDKCMASLLGKQNFKPCDIDFCWDVMTKLDSELYYTTHQLLWFQLGIKAGCKAKLEEKLRGTFGGFESIFRKLCTNVIFTMEALTSHPVSPLYQDIFLEQGFICGGMGFMDAVHTPWLAQVLTWQDPMLGCFKHQEDMIAKDDDLENLMYFKKKEWKVRSLLFDVPMGDSCSAHKSGVAAGFLAVYTRLFLDPEYLQHKYWPYIYGPGYISPDMWRKIIMRRIFAAVFIVVILAVLVSRIGLRRIWAFLRYWKNKRSKIARM